jgi:uncharacterized membrane protein
VNTIIGVFNEPQAARRAVDALHASSLKLDDVSVISRTDEQASTVGSAEGDVSAGQGAVVGAVWGGLVGLAALLIPGVGPFIAFGALGAALTGAVTGAVVGGITAALVDFSGMPADEARTYETMVTEGKTLVAVKARDEDATEARRILNSFGAEAVRDDQGTQAATPGRVHVAMYDEHGNRVHEDVDANPFIQTTLNEEIPPLPRLTKDTDLDPAKR